MSMSSQEMRDVDIRTVDLDELVDIADVRIDMSLPKKERALDFLKQIKNPYCFKIGKTAVKISFSDTDDSLEDCLERYLLSL